MLVIGDLDVLVGRDEGGGHLLGAVGVEVARELGDEGESGGVEAVEGSGVVGLVDLEEEVLEVGAGDVGVLVDAGDELAVVGVLQDHEVWRAELLYVLDGPDAEDVGGLVGVGLEGETVLDLLGREVGAVLLGEHVLEHHFPRRAAADLDPDLLVADPLPALHAQQLHRLLVLHDHALHAVVPLVLPLQLDRELLQRPRHLKGAVPDLEGLLARVVVLRLELLHLPLRHRAELLRRDLPHLQRLHDHIVFLHHDGLLEYEEHIRDTLLLRLELDHISAIQHVLVPVVAELVVRQLIVPYLHQPVAALHLAQAAPPTLQNVAIPALNALRLS